MKFAENWKRFWTLNRHHAAGFTLVELIVVIAILAILAGVAVPAYSGYVTQANKQADMSLISEIEQALTLAYYNDHANATAGYVILSVSADAEADKEDGFADKAMQAAFGENWEKNAVLKYDGWVDSGLLNTVLDTNATLVNDSTYIQEASSDDLMNTVTKLTNAAASAMTNTDDPVGAMAGLLGITEEEITQNLNGVTKEEDPDKYHTILSNMMVTYLANEFTTSDGSNASVASELAIQYATMYAYSLTNEDAAKELETITQDLANAKNQDELVDSVINMVDLSEDFAKGYAEYMAGEGANDPQAFLDIMKAVDSVSGQLTDMTNPDLYRSEQVSAMLGDYTNMVKAVSRLNLSDTDKAAIKSAIEDGAVVVLVGIDGTTVSSISAE